MQMSLLADGLQADLEALGELGDDSIAEAARRIAAGPGHSRVLDVLSEGRRPVRELPEGRWSCGWPVTRSPSRRVLDPAIAARPRAT